VHAGLVLGFAAGTACCAAIASVPCTQGAGVIGAARRHVEQNLLQTIAFEACGQLLGGIRIGEQILNRLEAILGRCFETVQKIHVGVHHGQVGGKLRHEKLSGKSQVRSAQCGWCGR